MSTIYFDKISVLPHFEVAPTGGCDLFWNVRGLTFTPGYRVQWARKLEGPWGDVTVAADPPISDNFLLNTLPLQRANFSDPVYFRIQVFKDTTLALTSEPFDNRNRMGKREFLMYREMLRQTNLALSKVIAASRGFLLRRKIYGARCPDCLDEVLDTVMSSDCPTCFGTGIVGGFYPPVTMCAAWGPEGNARNVNTIKDTSGPVQIARHRITIFAFPEARSEDVWVDDGSRFMYLVEKNDPLAFCGSAVEQRLTVSRLPAHHPFYKYQIDVSGNHPGNVEDAVVLSSDDDQQ